MNVFFRPILVAPAVLAAAALLTTSATPVSAATATRDLGRLAPATTVDLVLGMRLRDSATLDALLAAQSDPKSPLYRHFLRSAQLRDAFGASRAGYAHTLATLRARGFTIVKTDPLRASVDVAAPAQTVEKYFSTSLHAVASKRGIGSANVTRTHVPAELASAVDVVGGLGGTVFSTAYEAQVGYGKKRHGAGTLLEPPTVTHATPGATPGPTPQFGPDGGYGPQPIEGAFDFPIRHGYFGNGATVADVIDGEFSDKTDIAPYLAEFNVKRNGPPTAIRLVDGGCGGEANCFDSFSAAIDAQNIIGTAPGVSYVVYEISGLSNRGIIDGLNAVVSDNTADVVNFAVGGCEAALGETAYLIDRAYALGSAEGITFETVTFGGSDPCGIPFHTSVQAPADSPHTATVGGADSFVDRFNNVTSPPLANTSTGGGYSTLFAVPAYQKGVHGVNGGGRNLPDFSGPDAINGVGPSIYFPLFGGWIGGFPFVNNAPVAGALAEAAQLNGRRLGLVNTSLYALYEKDGTLHAPFRDITLGCNAGDGYGPFCAAPGFDLVSGLGAPDFYRIATSL